MKQRGRFRAEFDFEGTFIHIDELFQRFPFFVRRLLAETGAAAAREFYDNYASEYLNANKENSLGLPLTGGEFEYETQVRGKNSKTRYRTIRYRHKTSGRRMVSFSVDKKGKFVQIKSFPLNVLRRGAERGIGAGVFRSFKSGFNATAAAREGADKVGKAFCEDAERMVRGSFSRGESPFGPAREGMTKVSR
jgi:hypothetical protein